MNCLVDWCRVTLVFLFDQDVAEVATLNRFDCFILLFCSDCFAIASEESTIYAKIPVVQF